MLGIVAIGVLIICWRYYAARRNNAYRRAGLALLGEARTVYDISVLLKRVALAVSPREQVASLYGETWITFLNRTCSRSHFSKIGTTESDTKASQELIELARVWIKYHHVPSDPTLQLTSLGLRKHGKGG
jgi:hypothetical protein